MKKIFYDGNFITLENYNVEAILVEDGFIKKVGNKDDIFSYKDKNTELISLEGYTMMPSFIDSHSHFSGIANGFLKVNLEGCKSFNDIQEVLKKYKEDHQVVDNVWILSDGYDHNSLIEKRHPNKELIDEIFPNNPVVLQHKSGHVGVFNSAALRFFNVTNDTHSCNGGMIEKVGGSLTGYMEENSFLNYLKEIPMPSMDNLLNAYEKAQELYLSYGITTIQDGMAYPSMIPIYQNLVSNRKLKLDLVSYIEPNSRKVFFDTFSNCIRKYYNNFKIGGYKIFLDGSPQSRTAWMRTPYVGENMYLGYNTMDDKDVEDVVKTSKDTNMQLLAHCNGDKAAEQYINSIKKFENDIEEIRPVMIHAQFVGLDQLSDLKKYHIIPSFFIEHVFYWGDIHIENFGYERASLISPANSALKQHILFTFHQDSPVIKPNMFETIWCATTRKTKKGVILGENEKISVLDAIKAVTINSAYQYFEEDKKGSIKEGKLANLIIVDKNPLEISLDELKNIQVLETIKEGVSLFKRN